MFKFQFFKFFDFFGYIPQFRIRGSERFTSKFGGFIFLLFIIITIGFIIFQTYSFIDTLNTPKSSVIIYRMADNIYELTPTDTYFGISLKDSNGKALDLIKYPYFNINFSIVNFTNKLKQETILKTEKCNITNFLFHYDLDRLDNRDEIEKSLMNDYICLANFKSKIKPSHFTITSYFSIKINIDEKYRNDQKFYDFMKNTNPKVSFVYSNSNYNSMNKNSPYFSKIEETTIELDIDVIKSSEFLYSPFETLDNDGLFLNDFQYFNNTKFSSQKNGTVFQLKKNGDSFKMVDLLTPKTTLLKFRLKISNTVTQNYRSFKHIQDLISAIGSVLPNIYLIFLVFANTVNQVKGKNLLMGSIYSNEIIDKLKEFQKDKNIRKSISNLNRNNSLKLKDTEIKIDLDYTQGRVECLDNVKSIELVEKSDSNWNLDELFENNQLFKFSFKDYLKSLINSDRKSILIKNAFSKFDEAIEIDGYLSLKQEFEFFKDVFMKNHQKLIFETASKYKNLKSLFSRLKSSPEEKNFSVTEAISKLYERKDEYDNLLIDYLENSVNY